MSSLLLLLSNWVLSSISGVVEGPDVDSVLHLRQVILLVSLLTFSKEILDFTTVLFWVMFVWSSRPESNNSLVLKFKWEQFSVEGWVNNDGGNGSSRVGEGGWKGAGKGAFSVSDVSHHL